ncbi:hypothetical protein [Mixta intestinalis]|uniref:Uncharacterized protein n=1 Tax=Mixta intestinalis TaxID=1615494 RepID=A0A6P1Q5R2_9GAMM|nr:hypothetical protein [Mixta intestinalis]QHM74003.1 hypothetical protein C7M51_04364 [Mixta intestinalis]
MAETYRCFLKPSAAEFICDQDKKTLTVREFEALTPRRERPKLPVNNRMAGAMWQHFSLNKRLKEFGGDPTQTPLLILNRFANWDYVAEMMCGSQSAILEAINCYVATAWFPATLQGYLTIEHGNTAEALTLATTDTGIQAAAIDSIFQRDRNGMRMGCVIVGTFECLPQKIGSSQLSVNSTVAFGALSIVLSQDNESTVIETLTLHKELYQHVFNI